GLRHLRLRRRYQPHLHLRRAAEPALDRPLLRIQPPHVDPRQVPHRQTRLLIHSLPVLTILPSIEVDRLLYAQHHHTAREHIPRRRHHPTQVHDPIPSSTTAPSSELAPRGARTSLHRGMAHREQGPFACGHHHAPQRSPASSNCSQLL